ncbi:MAG: hypothetical protein GY832_11265 [Chloroflexi bacterium]|nr:hypothetical protein [Chloroflexota bacterium]
MLSTLTISKTNPGETTLTIESDIITATAVVTGGYLGPINITASKGKRGAVSKDQVQAAIGAMFDEVKAYDIKLKEAV